MTGADDEEISGKVCLLIEEIVVMFSFDGGTDEEEVLYVDVDDEEVEKVNILVRNGGRGP